MPSYLLAAVAAGALCACSAPAVPLAAGPSNPADPSAPDAPFVRPANVLAMADPPSAASLPTEDSGPMVGMSMSGGAMTGVDHGGMTMPDAPGLTQAASGLGSTQTAGKVTAVDWARGTVGLTHQPVGVPGGPSIATDFRVAPSVDLRSLTPGQAVTFALGAPDADGDCRVEGIQPR